MGLEFRFVAAEAVPSLRRPKGEIPFGNMAVAYHWHSVAKPNFETRPKITDAARPVRIVPVADCRQIDPATIRQMKLGQ